MAVANTFPSAAGLVSADKAITAAIDRHVQTEQDNNDEDDGMPGDLAPVG